jgi:hypothetical protein
MVILVEKSKPTSKTHRINEVQEIPVLRFETFVQTIVSGEFKPNHIEIYSKQSTRFHVAFVGKFTTDAKSNFVDFSSNGPALTVISIGENDVNRIHRSPNPSQPFFRIEMKNGLTFFVSETR